MTREAKAHIAFTDAVHHLLPHSYFFFEVEVGRKKWLSKIWKINEAWIAIHYDWLKEFDSGNYFFLKLFVGPKRVEPCTSLVPQKQITKYLYLFEIEEGTILVI